MDELRIEPSDAVGTAQTLATEHDADIAEALNDVDPAGAARVIAALPFELAVRTLNQPEFDRRAKMFEHLPADKVPEAVEQMVEVYMRERRDGERFIDTFRRTGLIPFKEAVYAEAH